MVETWKMQRKRCTGVGFGWCSAFLAIALGGAAVAFAQDAAGGFRADAGPLRVSAGIMAGNLIKRVYPVIPESARAQNGAMVMRVLISKTGSVEQAEAISGPEALRPFFLDAVRQWTYKPYLLNGEAVEVYTTITVSMGFGGTGAGMMREAASPPRVLSAPNPEFTEEARRKKLSGNVLVSLTVDERGVPVNVKVVRGLGSGLDEKAVEAVAGYRFRPAMKDGKPVAQDLHISVNFQIF